jgi:limonene-1,2-epoxide hydrolase
MPPRDPADVVRAVLQAARDDDTEALVVGFSPDCRLLMPEGQYEGHEGVRRLAAARRERPSGVENGEPEHVGDGHVLVPLRIETQVGDRTVEVRATGVWTVEDGLVKKFRGMPGGRRSALRELGLLAEPEDDEPIGPDAVRPT